MSILRTGARLGLGLALVAGCSAEGENVTTLERVRTQMLVDGIPMAPPSSPYAPPAYIGTYENARGENIDLTVREGVPNIESRDYSRFAGLIMNCYVKPILVYVDGKPVVDRTAIVVRIGETPNLEVVAPNDTQIATEKPESTEPTLIYCQPAFVREAFGYDASSNIAQYCMEVSQEANGEIVPTEDLSTCRISY